MSREEFLKAVAYVTAACGKALAPASLEVYFDCLGDLPYDVMLTAAKRVVLEHKFATFPTVAEFREAAAETLRGRVKELSAAEAWEAAWAVVRNTDPEIEGSFARATRDTPPLVVEAIRAFGLQALCYGKEPVGVVRGQFLKIFEQLAARDRRAALLPAPVKLAIEERAADRQERAREVLKLAGYQPPDVN